MLTDRELSLMRAEQEKLMPETVIVERVTATDDGFGGTKDDVWAVVASGVPARITQAQTLDMGGQAGRKIEVEKWTVRVPFGTDIQERDRILWGAVIIRVDEVKLGSHKTALTVAGERVK